MTSLQKQIISLLQTHQRLSRKSLHKALNVTAAAMSQNIKLLIQEEYIKEDEIIDSKKAGRKEILLVLNPDRYFFYGVEIESKLSLVKSNLLGQVTESTTFDSFDDLLRYLNQINREEYLAISFSKKGFFSENNLNNEEKAFLVKLKEKSNNVFFNNNIACLAYSYKYYHPEAESFILVKYGPGLGSASFINNQLLKNDRYPTFELGKLQVNLEGDTLEKIISYDSLDITSDTILERFEKDSDLRKKIVILLTLAIKVPNTLLQLDKIIVSGELFQNHDNYLLLKEEFAKDNNFDINKLAYIDNYKEFNQRKSVITAIYLFLNS